ncbi:MAG: hypothetical protein OHK0023_06460 [Anaerolineae bacterium]
MSFRQAIPKLALASTAFLIALALMFGGSFSAAAQGGDPVATAVAATLQALGTPAAPSMGASARAETWTRFSLINVPGGLGNISLTDLSSRPSEAFTLTFSADGSSITLPSQMLMMEYFRNLGDLTLARLPEGDYALRVLDNPCPPNPNEPCFNQLTYVVRLQQLDSEKYALYETASGYEYGDSYKSILYAGDQTGQDRLAELFIMPRCFGAPAPRLIPNITALVIYEQGLNLRSAPGRTANLVMGVNPYTEVQVLNDTPVCQDNLIYWKVRVNGREGWIAEGSGDAYWLWSQESQPLFQVSDWAWDKPLPEIVSIDGRLQGSGVPIAPTLAPTLVSLPVPSQLDIAVSAEVLQPDVIVYAGNAANTARLVTLQLGNRVTVLDGPVSAGGELWWQVWTADNVIGWVTEMRDGQATLKPLEQPVGCVGFLPSRMIIGERGAVLPGEPNALNSLPLQPSQDSRSRRIGTIRAGQVFTVLAGPVCSAYPYWLVDVGGQRGWTAEGDPNTYWIEPVR